MLLGIEQLYSINQLSFINSIKLDKIIDFLGKIDDIVP